MLQIKWGFFYPASDGFDVIIRDTGAENGDVVAEFSVRGDDFKKFVDEVLTEGLVEKPEAGQLDEAGKAVEAINFLEARGYQISGALPEATSADWANEPEPVVAEEVEPEDDGDAYQ